MHRKNRKNRNYIYYGLFLDKKLKFIYRRKDTDDPITTEFSMYVYNNVSGNIRGRWFKCGIAGDKGLDKITKEEVLAIYPHLTL